MIPIPGQFQRKKRPYQKEIREVRAVLSDATEPLTFNQVLRLCDEKLHQKAQDKKNHVAGALNYLIQQGEAQRNEEDDRTLFTHLA